jgi:putative PIN family toxin of toxin-antitoxin system
LTIVFDSNIWISALRFGGVPLTALRATYLRHTLAYCDEIEAEVLRVLEIKFGWSRESAAPMMKRYLERGLRVRISGKLKNISRDANDDMVVECALVAHAQIIVSGDKDLLSLGKYSGITVLSPAAYIMQELAP